MTHARVSSPTRGETKRRARPAFYTTATSRCLKIVVVGLPPSPTYIIHICTALPASWAPLQALCRPSVSSLIHTAIHVGSRKEDSLHRFPPPTVEPSLVDPPSRHPSLPPACLQLLCEDQANSPRAGAPHPLNVEKDARDPQPVPQVRAAGI